MSDLVGFLKARLDEDERLARGHRQPSPSWGDFDMDGELRDDVNAGTVAYIPHAGDRAHIARHDPARVLADVDAKRRTVDRHAQCGTGSGYCDDGGHGWDGGDVLGCADLADLALPYADHADYREGWRP